MIALAIVILVATLIAFGATALIAIAIAENPGA
jgi:hypothetical protein